MNTNFEQIMRMPLGVVMTAFYYQFNYKATDKRVAAQSLANLVDSGRVLLDTIRNTAAIDLSNIASPAQGTVAAGAGTSPSSISLDDVLSATNEKLINLDRKLSTNFSADINRLGSAIETMVLRNQKHEAILQEKIIDLESKITTSKQHAESFKVDPSQVTTAVAASIAAEFGKFKREVEKRGAQEVVADLSAIHPVAMKPAFDVFNCNVRDALNRDLDVQCWNSPTPPAVDPNFIWRESVLRHLILSEQTGENLWFGGEKGAGKTQTAQQFAACTGRSFTRINFHKYTTAEEYIGSTGLQNGNTVFVEGDFLRAYETPGTVILLDEITNAAPGELAPLNALLEPNAAVNIGGKIRTRAPGVIIIAADNTLTNGDQSGRYSGTQQMNSALADRFSRVIPFKHLDYYHEVAAVQRHTGCNETLAKAVIDLVSVCRQQVDAGNMVDAPSIRQIVAFIRALPVLGAEEAFDTCIASRQPGESEVAINAIKASHLNQDIFKG